MAEVAKEEPPKEEPAPEQNEEAAKPEEQAEAPKNDDNPGEPKKDDNAEAPKKDDDKKEKDAAEEPKKDDNAESKPDDDNKQNDDSKAAEDADPPKVDFSGTWVLKSSSKSIDEYYKSEGWSYMMRKFAPMIAMKQVIKQEGNKLTIQMIVGPGGKFANETSSSIVDSGKEFEYKDKDGVCRGVSKWNKDKTQIITDIYRVDDKKRTYQSVRSLSTLSDKKMIITTKNSHGKEITQNYQKEETK